MQQKKPKHTQPQARNRNESEREGERKKPLNKPYLGWDAIWRLRMVEPTKRWNKKKQTTQHNTTQDKQQYWIRVLMEFIYFSQLNPTDLMEHKQPNQIAWIIQLIIKRIVWWCARAVIDSVWMIELVLLAFDAGKSQFDSFFARFSFMSWVLTNVGVWNSVIASNSILSLIIVVLYSFMKLKIPECKSITWILLSVSRI